MGFVDKLLPRNRLVTLVSQNQSYSPEQKTPSHYPATRRNPPALRPYPPATTTVIPLAVCPHPLADSKKKIWISCSGSHNQRDITPSSATPPNWQGLRFRGYPLHPILCSRKPRAGFLPWHVNGGVEPPYHPRRFHEGYVSAGGRGEETKIYWFHTLLN